MSNDAIAKSKRILALVDDYHDKPTNDTRTALRKALMDEFEPHDRAALQAQQGEKFHHYPALSNATSAAVKKVRATRQALRAQQGEAKDAPAPATLSDDEIIAQWLEFDSWPMNSGATIFKFARVLLAATGGSQGQDAALLTAVGKLIKAKGRYHTEQNYAALMVAYDAAMAAKEVGK